MLDAKSLVSEASSGPRRSATILDDSETIELQQHLEKCEYVYLVLFIFFIIFQ